MPVAWGQYVAWCALQHKDPPTSGQVKLNLSTVMGRLDCNGLKVPIGFQYSHHWCTESPGYYPADWPGATFFKNFDPAVNTVFFGTFESWHLNESRKACSRYRLFRFRSGPDSSPRCLCWHLAAGLGACAGHFGRRLARTSEEAMPQASQARHPSQDQKVEKDYFAR